MVKTTATIIALLALTGCATTRPDTTPPTEIRVPVLSCPAPPSVARPELLSPTLQPTDANDPGKVVQFYAADLLQVQGYAEQLELILEAYRTTSGEMGDFAKRLEELKNKSTITPPTR